jgi:hypothetical protein
VGVGRADRRAAEGLAPLSLVDSRDEGADLLLDDDGLRRLTAKGLVRYSNRGEQQLEQAKGEAFRRLTKRAFKGELDEKKPADIDG